MHTSSFLYYLANETRHVPASVLRAVKEEARSRLMARYAANRADGELTFTDLWERCEKYAQPS